MSEPVDGGPGECSRRGFLKGTGVGLVAGALVAPTGAQSPTAAPGAEAEKLAAGSRHPVRFELNGKVAETDAHTGQTLLDVLRDQLDHTGSKLVCDMGTCGACTVIIDGRPTNSCLVLAVEVQGSKVETIEGLAKDGALHPVQQAFIEEDGLQCGFCTPGMVMSCKALLERNPAPSRFEVKSALAGNICRCGTYENIFRAVDVAAKRLRGGR